MSIIEQIEAVLEKGSLDASPESRYVFRTDTTKFMGNPDVVVNVRTENEIAKIVSIASKNGVAVIARGAGTGMSGGAVPIKGGILLNFETMNEIIKIDPKKKLAFVQPGVITDDLRRSAREFGLYYPPDPSSSAVSTIGGNFAENAGGLHCVKYGVTSRYVKGFKFVDSSGIIQKCGVYDEDNTFPGAFVMIGSEGTLGIVTEIALELIDNPPLYDTYITYHDSLLNAIATVIKLKGTAINPAVIELIDKDALKAAVTYTNITLPENTEAVLIIKLDSYFLPELLEKTILIENIFSLMKVREFRKAENEDEERSFWDMRKAVSTSIKKISPDKMNEDICVPLSNMYSFIESTRDISEKYSLKIVVYGHAGDGNLHVNILFDKNNKTESNNARLASEEVFKKTIELGGNISGEHGIGLAKKNFLSLQYSKNEIAFMKKIKKAFDPDNIFNPDKIFNVTKG
ncbi:MAG TPA: FAD-linked oxidase C-terminal domain-containing protein [Clostridiales bacterium]|nr:FAD-linked oxidase C-terminal domain-containing protein [Clostridiales bacterium]HQP69361.1 FAD-linked oxidase C-terminal domain-containing protein [Clostridiales bacterium]